MSAAPEKKKPGHGLTPGSSGRTPGARALTIPQKAEAVALWRAGAITLDGLAKKFKKRPETFSRLFTRMGVEKGSGEAAAMREAEKAVSSKTVTDLEVTLDRIAKTRDTHYRMSSQIALMAFADLQRHKRAELDIAKLKDSMSVYKMLSEIVGNSRKELFEVLNVEQHSKNEDLDDLPDLTVRELTQDEVATLRDAPEVDLDDAGADMIDLEDDELDT
jgi:hypothetical protein